MLETIQRSHDTVLSRHALGLTKLVKDVLQADIGRVVLDQSELRCECDSSGQVELQVSPSCFLSTLEDAVHDSEKLSEALFSSAVTGSRHLHIEGVRGAIGTEHRDSSKAVPVSSA